jgi:Ca2+-binding EF-hand superfamily protein
MTRLLSIAIAFGLVLSLAATADAADVKKKKKKEGNPLDAVFAKLDTNNDKKISKDEFNAFKGLHTPKPGKEAKEPKGFAEARNTWFTKLDTNKDGFLTKEEFSKIQEVMKANPPIKKKAK